MRCWIFDVDGTLTNVEHRAHHMRKEPKDLEAFEALAHLDPPHPAVVDLAHTLQRIHKVVYVTARSERHREQTKQWLTRHRLWNGSGVGWPEGAGDRLYMRAEGDHRPDAVVKLELLAMLRNDGFEPIMAFEDRNSVVAMWRAAGVPCAQVAEGDF